MKEFFFWDELSREAKAKAVGQAIAWIVVYAALLVAIALFVVGLITVLKDVIYEQPVATFRCYGLPALTQDGEHVMYLSCKGPSGQVSNIVVERRGK
jgi:hypothetical protein